jgi:hypothetical protein
LRRYNKGWTQESERHSLAARGIKTGHKMSYNHTNKYNNRRKQNDPFDDWWEFVYGTEATRFMCEEKIHNANKKRISKGYVKIKGHKEYRPLFIGKKYEIGLIRDAKVKK